MKTTYNYLNRAQHKGYYITKGNGTFLIKNQNLDSFDKVANFHDSIAAAEKDIQAFIEAKKAGNGEK